MAVELSSAIEVHLGPDEIELRRVAGTYPCLVGAPSDGSFAFTGTFPVLDGDHELDAFKVRIELRSTGRAYFAHVFETGRRIPRTTDRHMYGTGEACIALPEDIYVITGGAPMGLMAFLDGPVRSYFLAQLVVERGGDWPFDERAHGSDAVHDFYEDLFDTRDITLVALILRLLVYQRTSRQWICPWCQRGAKVRRCHHERLDSLRTIVTPALASRLLSRLVAGEAKRHFERTRGKG